MTHYDAIFILGPQGSGKGTQAKLLAGKLGFHMWDTGKVLREHRDMKAVSGQTVGEILDSGRLFTDEELFGVVKPLILELPMEQGILFDGIPRRMGQATFLVDFLKSKGRDKLATVVIEVPTEESLKRLLLRAEKEGRADDTEKAIRYRLEQYESETKPMLPFMEKETDLFRIDGIGSVGDVAARVEQALGLGGKEDK
jgi:adenylate kinase